jgi:tRNA A-37 threonylcarbamoyl transferase component Bud32
VDLATVSCRVLRDGPLGQTLCRTLGTAGVDSRNWLCQNTRILKDEAQCLVGMATIDDRDCFLKLYPRPALWSFLRRPFGHSSAVRGFDAAQHLCSSGLSVPAPLCCLLLPAGALLVTEAAPGSDLASLWQGDPGHALDWLSIMQRSAQALAALHRSGHAHGDCKWSNLVLDGNCCTLVGLETVAPAAPASHLQALDIARFSLCAEELQLPLEYYHAFLESYCQEMRCDWHWLAAAIRAPLARLRRRARRRLGYRGHQLLG